VPDTDRRRRRRRPLATAVARALPICFLVDLLPALLLPAAAGPWSKPESALQPWI